MQIKGKYSWLKHIDFMIVDLIALFISFVISYWVKFSSLEFVRSDPWLRLCLITSLLNLLIALFTNPYSGIFRRSYYMEVITAFQLALYNLVLTSVFIYLFKVGKVYSREVFFTMFGLYFIISLILKYIWKKLLLSRRIVVKTTERIPLFVVGSKETIDRTIKNVTAGDFRLYDIKGVDSSSNFYYSIPIIDDYVPFVLKNNITDVLIAVEPARVPKQDLEELNRNGINVSVIIESIVGFQPEDQFIQNVGVYKTVNIGVFSFTPGQMFYLLFKRLFDILFALIGLAVLIPVTAIIKLIYLASHDTAPVFYRQMRVGQHGKTIKIWKFRSMVPNADEILQEMLKDEKWRKEWKENQKFENDPRITRAGKFLRKTSIDELPQLFNVLIGDMSLVGPRPLVIGELEQHGGLKLYQKVKPGITGWWGCNGRSNISYRERLELEYYYVKNCSLQLDVLCIFRTLLAVLTKDGAH